jgi:hypothetical protein
MITRFILVALLALPVPLGGSPWDKPPANWNLSDVSKILLDSPWSPATVKLEREITAHQTDPQTRLQTDAPVNSDNANQIPGIQISRSRPQPKVPVIWWSSKTVRLAQQRLHQLSNPALPADHFTSTTCRTTFSSSTPAKRCVFSRTPRKICATPCSWNCQTAPRST